MSGAGGCLLVEATKGKDADIKFVPISPFVWEEIEVAIDGPWEDGPIKNLSDLERLLRRKAEQLLDEGIKMPDMPWQISSWQPDGYLVPGS